MSSAVTPSTDSAFDPLPPTPSAQTTTDRLNDVIQMIANNCILENPFLSLPTDPTVFLHPYLTPGNDHDFLIQESDLEKMCKDFNLFFTETICHVFQNHWSDPQIQVRVFTRFANNEVEIVEHATFLDPNRAFSKKTISNIHALAMEALLTQIEENASLIRLDSSYTSEERKQILDIITTLASCHPGQRLLLLLLQNNKPIHFKKGDAWKHISDEELDTVLTNLESLKKSIFFSPNGNYIDDLKHHVSTLAHELIHALQKTNTKFPWKKSIKTALSCSCCVPETNNRLRQISALFPNVEELCTILPVANLLCENFFLEWFDQPQRAGHTVPTKTVALLLKQTSQENGSNPNNSESQLIETKLLERVYASCVVYGLHQDSLTLSLYLAQTKNNTLLGSLLETSVWKEIFLETTAWKTLLKSQASTILIQGIDELLSNPTFQNHFTFFDNDVKSNILYTIAKSHFLPQFSSSAARLCLLGSYELSDPDLYETLKTKNLFSKLNKEDLLSLLKLFATDEENTDSEALKFCFDLLAASRQLTPEVELDLTLFLDILKNAFYWMRKFPDEAFSLINALQEKLETQPSFLNEAITTLFTNKPSPPKPYFALVDLITKNSACQNFLQKNVVTKNILKNFASSNGRQDLVQAINAIKSHREKRPLTNSLELPTHTGVMTRSMSKKLKSECIETT